MHTWDIKESLLENTGSHICYLCSSVLDIVFLGQTNLRNRRAVVIAPQGAFEYVADDVRPIISERDQVGGSLGLRTTQLEVMTLRTNKDFEGTHQFNIGECIAHHIVCHQKSVVVANPRNHFVLEFEYDCLVLNRRDEEALRDGFGHIACYDVLLRPFE